MSIKIIAKNKRASHDYFLLEKHEAGLSLQGTEVKSLRLGKVSLADAYIAFDSQGEAWIYNMHISPYEFGNRANHEETRKRKLLMHKKEIVDLALKVKKEGATVIPTMIYFKRSRVKIEIALAKGKKQHDKRQALAQKDAEKKIRKGEY